MESRVLDVLLERAGRDRRGNLIGTIDDLEVARALAHVAVGVCPACAYALEGIGAAPDGCLVCPECGGAWRLADGPPRERSEHAARFEASTDMVAALNRQAAQLRRFFGVDDDRDGPRQA